MFKSLIRFSFQVLCLPAFLGFFLIQPVMAVELDPIVGTWQTVDDKTNEPVSYVKISLVNQKLEASVVKLLTEPNAVCSLCTDYRKNQPVLGMKIMSGLVKKSDGEWGGGEILDPDDGHSYRVHLKLQGNKLVVRGYIGIPLFGREQIWTRVIKE
jgi:uncharacterized protein (DUF2147 family)